MPLASSDIEKLYNENAQALLGFFAARTFNPDAAVELLAETFAAAFIARAQFRGTSSASARAWLYGIGHNLLREYFRRGRVEREALRRLGVEPQPLSDAEYDQIEDALVAGSLRGELAVELSRLPEEQRDAIGLRVLAELPYPEVARMLGVTEQAARARVSRGLRSLRGTDVASDEREASENG